MVDRLVENGQKVWALQQALHEGEFGLSNVPALIKLVVGEDRWRQRIDEPTGEVVEFSRFEDFVCTGPPAGLGADLRILERLCSDDRDAQNAIAIVTQNKRGRPPVNDDNVHIYRGREAGNSPQAALRRLCKDRPDLHERVLAGDLSPHAAMKEAGFRPPTITVRTDDVRAAAYSLRRHFQGDRLRELREALAMED